MINELAVVCNTHKKFTNLYLSKGKDIKSFAFMHRNCSTKLVSLCSSLDMEDNGFGEYEEHYKPNNKNLKKTK